MTTSSFGTFIASLVQSAFDYIVAGLVAGNVMVYLIVITVIGGVVSLVVWGLYKIFHLR
jgi:hypothetical protein